MLQRLTAFLGQPGRLRAFLLHLACSAVVVGSLGALMLLLWYPQPWFIHDGGWTVYRLILLVDVVLGPLLTLIVFRRGKPELRRDLTIIVALQLAALSFGVTTMWQYRPAYVVYAEENFFTVTWKEVRQGTVDMARLERFAGGRGLPMVYLQLPEHPVRRSALRAAAGRNGPPISAFGDYYEAMTPERWAHVLKKEPDMLELARQDAGISAELGRFRARHPGPLERFAFIPVVCRDEVLMLALDRNTMALVDWMN